VQVETLEKIARDAGFEQLKPAQRKALTLLCQGKPLLVVWPTGSGKSLVYQLPAMALDGLTLVISPLIALMEDQTAKGRALKWPVTCVHSAVGRTEREKRLRQVHEGKIKLLYVTPERFRSPEFLRVVKERGVKLLAVDEAHCISQWGHDFRPDYSKLGDIRKMLGNPQVMALTATATKVVQADIVQQLSMGPEAQILWEGVERPNLHLSATELDREEDKLLALEKWLGEVSGPKIVYCTLIGTLERVSEWLQTKRILHEVYHGERGDQERKRAQKEFLGGNSQLMLATPAFGLGVDRARGPRR
jgi:ATP-dependent DNA helicase RecQ